MLLFFDLLQSSNSIIVLVVDNFINSSLYLTCTSTFVAVLRILIAASTLLGTIFTAGISIKSILSGVPLHCQENRFGSRGYDEYLLI